MNYEKSESLVEKNFNIIKILNKDFAILTDKMTIDFEETNSGDTCLKTSHMNIGNQHQHISKISGISEDVLFSYVFYHEIGHQILPWALVPNEQRANLMTEFFNEYNTYQESFPESFLLLHGLDIMNDKNLVNFREEVLFNASNKFEHFSIETLQLLSNFGFKIDAIYHEQFAECFSMFMINKQFPKQFEKLTELIIENRKNGELFYRDNHDDLMADSAQHSETGLDFGFVHCLHNITKEYAQILKNQKVTTFEQFKETAMPLIDKHTALEMKVALDSHKLGMIFPKELIIEEPTYIKHKIKALRELHSNPESSLKNKI